MATTIKRKMPRDVAGLSDTEKTAARTGLGLGSVATVDSPVPLANGGLGATTASGGRGTLGLSRAVVTVDSIADLKALAVSPALSQVHVLGYYAAGDGGGGVFNYSSGSAASDNGGTIIAPTTGSGRWLRVDLAPINVRWFGAKGDGSTSDTAAFQAAISSTTDGTDVAFHVPASSGDYSVNCASLTFGTRRITWVLDSKATVGGDLIQSRADSTLLPGMTIWGGLVFRTAQATAAVPSQVIRTNDPLNFFGTEAAWIVQQRDATSLTSGGAVDGAIYAFKGDGDGAIISYGGDSYATDSFWRGMRVQMEKTGGGSGHCLTFNGTLGAVGVIGPYNELGGIQGFLRNTGSSNGYVSAFEGRVSDSENSAGLNARDTRMIGVVGGVEKYKTGATRYSHAIYAQSMGSQDVDTAFKADGLFRDGVNFADSPISRWSMIQRADGSIGWLRFSDNSDTPANCNRMYQDGDALIVRMGGSSSAYAFKIMDSAGNQPFDFNGSNGRTTLYRASVTDPTGFIISSSNTPASAGAIGAAGTICWDSNYLYVCTATNTWKRAALSTW